MGGSESEAVFNSLNLNPQLFINEALNTVDDLVDEAFDFYLQQASTLLKTEGTDRSQDLCKNELPDESSISEDALSDPDLDGQLNSLRAKLNVAGKESAELNRELRALEKQSSSSDRFASEALQLYEENSMHDMFQEMVKMASELRIKMDKLKARRMEDRQQIRTERVFNPKGEFCTINHGKGLYNAELQDLQEFVSELKNI
ncbi:protein MIS12 homolog isoform X2 [Pistacia vera]|uniref:protein MIS12 homolog isoform X2 n=1 Tax=Pistacia vera TaxID=55513 RepID=UPI0012638798|nr:protein MIS12 homolog isoform X2 [Pistacia vera]